MALKNINENPTIADTVFLEFETPNSGGCFVSMPYKVDRVVVYFVERNFAAGNEIKFDTTTPNDEKELEAQTAEALACQIPSVENIDAARKARDEATAAAHPSTFYYTEARPVATFGTSDFPAWLGTDTDNAILTVEQYDADGNVQYGHFSLEWNPLGMREGDYFVCWTWTPNPAGDSISNYKYFNLQGATQLTTAIPTHFTNPTKYPMLLERYLPEMFKMYMSDDDLTPEVLESYHSAIGRQFTDLENLGNQIIDLTDANSTHETFLPVLASMYGVRLKSEDPTLWRRQIKEAIPLYKRKGTLGGLKDSLSSVGVTLNKVTKLWQVVSQYTWQESFKAAAGQVDFVLEKVTLPVDLSNFELSLRLVDTDDYVAQSDSDVSFSTTDGVTTMTWLGGDLEEGDILRVLYLYEAVPGGTEQTIENYVRTLPYSDQRDETDQLYPLKNWNVRVIEEDDPLFSVVIANRYPFHEPVVWGKIRTEFPFSENVYNMDEYNGSTRDSLDPCDIDKQFKDECSFCQSSKIIVDVEIENLSDHRMTEAMDTITDNVPFHAVVHQVNFSGGVTDIIQPPVETIECLVTMRGSESVVAGGAQNVFTRAMHNGLTTEQVLRDMVADLETAASGTATVRNTAISLFSGVVRFDRLGLDTASAVLEILAPSALAGEYSVENPLKNTVEVVGVTEPFTPSSFTYRLSNTVYQTSMADIDPADRKFLADDDQDWGLLKVVTQLEVDRSLAASAWTISIPAYSGTPYTILNALPDGTLELDDPSATLPTSTTTGVAYTMSDGVTTVASGTATMTAQRRGVVTVTEPVDVRELVKVNQYLLYSGTQYLINGFGVGSTDKFYIDGYTGSSVGMVTVSVYKRLVDSNTGQLFYKGMELDWGSDLEVFLGIMNGANADVLYTEDQITESDHFKENYLIDIDGSLYLITEIDGAVVTLGGGPIEDWTTTGVSESVTIYRYFRIPFDAAGETFAGYDRRGLERISSSTETALPMAFRAMVGNAIGTHQSFEAVGQEESISYTIEYEDGSTDQGEI